MGCPSHTAAKLGDLTGRRSALIVVLVAMLNSAITSARKVSLFTLILALSRAVGHPAS